MSEREIRIVQSVEAFMIAESLSFSSCYGSEHFFFICFISSPLSLIGFLICFSQTSNQQVRTWSLLQIRPTFFRFPFCHCWYKIDRLPTPCETLVRIVWSEKERNDDEIEIGYYIMLSRLVGIRQKKNVLTLKKLFCFGFRCKSNSRRKRNTKWFLKLLQQQKTWERDEARRLIP